MKKIITIAILCLASLGSSLGFAQSVQIDFDKKVIYCDSLNMPVNTTALELMTLLPEMLQRPGTLLLSNYEVKVQGMSINQGKDVALSSLHIEDIEKIVVDESPMSSYLNNGASGSIDIVLRQHEAKPKNSWGNVTLSASYPADFAPQVLLGHYREKMVVHGLMLADIYKNSTSDANLSFDNNGVLTSNSQRDIDSRYRTQLARAYMQFMPSQKDKIELKLSQTYTYNQEKVTPDFLSNMTESNCSKSTQLHALASYKRTFSPRSSLLFEGQYIYTPETYNDLYPLAQQLDRDKTSNTAAGKAEFETALLPQARKADLKFVMGSVFNNTTSKQDISSFYFAYDKDYAGRQDYNTFFTQPYLMFKLTAGKLRAKIEGQFQHFKYNLTNQDKETSVTNNDFTGSFVAEYHFTPHQNLRLFTVRSLQRPAATQVSTQPIFDAVMSNYVIGNNGLLPSLSHEVRMDYIADYKWNEHGLMLDASASYNHVNDIIGSTVVGEREALPGVILDCVSYENNGYNNIANFNLMAMHTYKSMTVSLTGNLYHNEEHRSAGNDHFTYYNLALYGQFRLLNGWQGSAKVAYYSKVHRTLDTLSDCAVSTLSIAKSINSHFSAYVFARIAMQQKAEDTSSASDGSNTISRYDMATNATGFGIRYTF